jgi:hypothetical protein
VGRCTKECLNSFAVVNLVRTLTNEFFEAGYYVRKVSLAVLGMPMRDLCSDCVPASIVLAVILATPMSAAFAQDSKRLAATFNERFPAEATSTPPPLDEIPVVKKEHSVIKHVPKAMRPRVAVAPRSFLDGGARVPPGRKFWVKESTPAK